MESDDGATSIVVEQMDPDVPMVDYVMRAWQRRVKELALLLKECAPHLTGALRERVSDVVARELPLSTDETQRGGGR